MTWFIIILIGATLIGNIAYFKKRESFKEHKGLVEFNVIMVSLIFAMLAFQQTQSAMESSTEEFDSLIVRIEKIIGDVEESKETLKDVERSLSKLPTQIDSFSSTIKSLNTIISSQKEQLTTTLTGFNESIYSFKSSVDSMVKRFNRKPNLNISLISSTSDTSVVINTIVITNNGSLLADVYRVRLHLPTELVLNVGNNYLKRDTEYDTFSTYQADISPTWPIDPNPKRPLKYDCDIILKNEYFEIKIFVYYRASFGNDGSVYQSFGYSDYLDKLIKIESK